MLIINCDFFVFGRGLENRIPVRYCGSATLVQSWQIFKDVRVYLPLMSMLRYKKNLFMINDIKICVHDVQHK